MNKLPTPAVLLAALAATLPAPSAHAAPVRNCGDMTNSFGTGDRNITSRVVSYHSARRFVRRFERRHGSSCPTMRPCRFGGYRCRFRQIGVEAIDTRCVRGRKVLRRQSAA